MLDPRSIFDDLENVKARLSTRGFDFDFSAVERLNTERRRLQKEYDDLRHQQTQASHAGCVDDNLWYVTAVN